MNENDSKQIRTYLQERKYAEAEKLCLDLETTSKQPQEKILLYDFFSRIFRETGRLVESEEYLRKELALAQELYEPSDLTIANILRNLSMTLDLQQKYQEAIPYAEKALSILRTVLPNDDQRITDAMVALGKHHYELGRFALAKDFLNEALERYTAKSGRHSLGVSACLNNLGRILENEGENEQSIPYFSEASMIRRDILGTHPDTAFALLNFGTALAGIGSYKEAAQVLIECRDMYLNLGLEDSPYLEACRENLMLCWNAVCTPC
ncbi:MAG: tetratricopeptide repeat protein [Desulfovibrionaceae bacterium]|nr:tetratricopeptide repeat protein [Desulfovibrionaceae bacterium]